MWERSVSEQNAAVAGIVRFGWWLSAQPTVGETGEDSGGGQVLAGPFADRLEAEAAVLSTRPDPVRPVVVVYGARDGNGVLRERSTPAERAWLAWLGQILDGLGEEWVALEEDDARVSLVVELVAALTDAGLPLHHDATNTVRAPEGEVRAGGVCLTPAPGGVIVAWRCSDRLSFDHVLAAGAVPPVMSSAVAGVLTALGFPVMPLAGSSAHLVTADR